MPPFISEGKWVADGIQKFGNWFRRRGWLGEVGEDGKNMGRRGVWWGRSEGGVRIVVESVTLYTMSSTIVLTDLLNQIRNSLRYHKSSSTVTSNF